MRIWQDLLERPSGPLALRFLIQPVVAGALAVRDGARDARSERKPYLWVMISNPAQRVALLRDGFTSVAKVLALAIVLDCVYQVIVFERFYPVEALIVGVLLAYVPYVLVRGPAARILRHIQARQRVQ